MPRKTHEQFMADFKRVNPYSDTIDVVGQYVKSNEKIECHCTIHDYTWFPRPNDLISGKQGCPLCGEERQRRKRTKSHESFVSELQRVNPNVVPLERYRGVVAKIRFKCCLCNNEWYATPHNMLSGFGCPNCHHGSTSFMEQFIYLSLVNVLDDKDVISRDRSTIGKELDIYVPELKLAIEIGSWQWHEKIVKADEQKRIACEEKGINLYNIYDGYPYAEKPFNGRCFVFKGELANDKSYTRLKQVIVSIMNEHGIEVSLSDDDWRKIEKQAYMNSRRLTTQGFKEKNEKLNPDIEIIGEYKGSKKHILCRCKKCNNEWSPVPLSILHGTGCPICGEKKRAAKRRKDDKTFLAEMCIKHPLIEVIGNYNGAFGKVRCRCKECGTEWEGVPSNLLHKSKPHGCPVCGEQRARIKHRKTNEQFVSELESRNPTIEALEKYSIQSQKIKCRCRICGKVWMARPDKLIAKDTKNRRGCPNGKKHEEFQMDK